MHSLSATLTPRLLVLFLAVLVVLMLLTALLLLSLHVDTTHVLVQSTESILD